MVAHAVHTLNSFKATGSNTDRTLIFQTVDQFFNFCSTKLKPMIYKNSAKCLYCEEEIVSRNRHDYQTCRCGNLSVDGGSAYIKRRGKNYLDTSITSENSFEEIREGFEWGTRGKEGDEELRYVKLKDLADDHILNILEHLKNCGAGVTAQLFFKELDYRRGLCKSQ